MKKMKGSLVVPQDEKWMELQQPLQSVDTDGISSSTLTYRHRMSPDCQRGERLASSRVSRDNLMHQMETIVLQEAELGSSLELLDYTRQKCNQQHDEIVRRLEDCEEMLRILERESATGVERLLSDGERVKWLRTKEMVTTILPEVLARLEDNIELNNAKIRDVRDKMEELRAKRLTLREEIAIKEEDIALALADKEV